MLRLIVLTIILVIWIGINFYIGWRGWQFFNGIFYGYGLAYWGVFTFLAMSYVIGRIAEKLYPGKVSRILNWVGSYWLAFLFYVLIMLLVVDGVRMLDNWFRFLPPTINQSSAYIGLLMVILLVFILIYGTVNARSPVISYYNITVPKKSNNMDKVHIVMVSDLHLGNIVNNQRLKIMIRKINQLEPDLILLVGDIIDENVRAFKREGMPLTLSKLNSKMGVYAVLGNHDYYGGQYREAISSLENAGITVLRDQHEIINNSFYLVGRDDKFSRLRSNLNHLLSEIDHSLPIILMDHNPIDIEEARKSEVDLQLSGHTHKGQLFPINRITKKIFETDWGYLQKDKLQVIVSNGFGTWGPPIRIGNKPEIVDILISFKMNEI